MPQYMVISNIKGNVTTKGFEGAIAITSSGHIAERSIIQRIGTTTQDTSLPTLHFLQISKLIDNASALLWQYFHSGKVIPKVDIFSCTLNQGRADWHSKLTLSNVMIARLTESKNDGGCKENLMLSFNKIERGYRSQDRHGAWQVPKHTSFDLQKAEAG